PIYKWGKEPMTDAERARLVEIIRSPHPSLLDASTPETLVDAKSGATKKQYMAHVVPRAALSSQRLAKLAVDSESLLTRAPLKRDQQRLASLLEQKLSDEALVNGLASFINEAESDELRAEAYRQMALRYPDVAADTPSELADTALVNAAVDRELRIQACYMLAEKQLRNEVTEDCAARSSATSDQPLEARLAGTVAFNRGAYGEALRSLETASRAINHVSDPGLHFRLGKSAQESGDDILACSTGKRLYQDAPLYPGVPKLLESCQFRKGVPALRKEIEGIRRQRVLNGEHPNPAKVPTLNLETEKFEPVQTNLAEPGKVTVAVFFATWCPHCKRELPKLVDFQSSLHNDPKLKDVVRVVAVRTLIERDTEEYSAFKERFKLNFPVLTDPAMGTAFAAFARSQGVARPGVPLLALVDESGDVRYILNSFEYSDTAQEIRWLIEELRG
ncbi:MAG: TlpA disulfide reductase family protein, partial [Myxococcota bacterium]